MTRQELLFKLKLIGYDFQFTSLFDYHYYIFKNGISIEIWSNCAFICDKRHNNYITFEETIPEILKLTTGESND